MFGRTLSKIPSSRANALLCSVTGANHFRPDFLAAIFVSMPNLQGVALELVPGTGQGDVFLKNDTKTELCRIARWKSN
jgi:hypothetical protein